MTAKVLASQASAIAEAARLLQAGQVVGMPTETVYGLAGNAFDPQALARIFEAKARPTFDPLIVHVNLDLSRPRLPQLEQKLGIVDLSGFSTPERAQLERLLERLWPGPLTFVLPKTPKIPDLATSGLPSVGLRMPRHPIARALIDAAKAPLAAPSANRFGRISPTRARDVLEELGDRIPLILDGGDCEVGLESTVIAISPGHPARLLRPGGIPTAEIEAILGAPLASGTTPTLALARQGGTAQLSPGMLESHYAPSRPLTLLPCSWDALDDTSLRAALGPRADDAALMRITGSTSSLSDRVRALFGHAPMLCLSLSEAGSLSEAAAALFAGLRALDHSGARRLFAEPCDRVEGLGHAIQDRLSRAAASRS